MLSARSGARDPASQTTRGTRPGCWPLSAPSPPRYRSSRPQRWQPRGAPPLLAGRERPAPCRGSTGALDAHACADRQFERRLCLLRRGDEVPFDEQRDPAGLDTQQRLDRRVARRRGGSKPSGQRRRSPSTRALPQAARAQMSEARATTAGRCPAAGPAPRTRRPSRRRPRGTRPPAAAGRRRQPPRSSAPRAAGRRPARPAWCCARRRAVRRAGTPHAARRGAGAVLPRRGPAELGEGAVQGAPPLLGQVAHCCLGQQGMAHIEAVVAGHVDKAGTLEVRCRAAEELPLQRRPARRAGRRRTAPPGSGRADERARCASGCATPHP